MSKISSVQELIAAITEDFALDADGALNCRRIKGGVIPTRPNHAPAQTESNAQGEAEIDPHDALTQSIYSLYHAQDLKAARDYFTPSENLARLTAYDLEDGEFVAAIKTAYGEAAYIDRDWRIISGAEQLDADRVRVEKGGLTLVARRDEIADQTGDAVSLKLPVAYPYRSPGFISFVSLHGPVALDPTQNLVRFYVSLDPEGAAPLIHALSGRLKREAFAFSFKIANAPDRFARFDAAVFYVAEEDAEKFLRAWRAADKSRCALRDAVSPFVKQMDTGLCLAEEPAPLDGVTVSFGMHRSKLVAEAVLRTIELHADLSEGRLAPICHSVFAANQVHIATPYLSFSWIDAYEQVKGAA